MHDNFGDYINFFSIAFGLLVAFLGFKSIFWFYAVCRVAFPVFVADRAKKWEEKGLALRSLANLNVRFVGLPAVATATDKWSYLNGLFFYDLHVMKKNLRFLALLRLSGVCIVLVAFSWDWFQFINGEYEFPFLSALAGMIWGVYLLRVLIDGVSVRKLAAAKDWEVVTYHGDSGNFSTVLVDGNEVGVNGKVTLFARLLN